MTPPDILTSLPETCKSPATVTSAPASVRAVVPSDARMSLPPTFRSPATATSPEPEKVNAVVPPFILMSLPPTVKSPTRATSSVNAMVTVLSVTAVAIWFAVPAKSSVSPVWIVSVPVSPLIERLDTTSAHDMLPEASVFRK